MVFDIISFSISSCCLYRSCKLGHNWDTENWTKWNHFGGVYATQYIQKWVIVTAKISYLCTGSGFILAKSQNTLQLAIATRKRVKTALAAEARLWPQTVGQTDKPTPSRSWWQEYGFWSMKSYKTCWQIRQTHGHQRDNQQPKSLPMTPTKKQVPRGYIGCDYFTVTHRIIVCDVIWWPFIFKNGHIWKKYGTDGPTDGHNLL